MTFLDLSNWLISGMGEKFGEATSLMNDDATPLKYKCESEATRSAVMLPVFYAHIVKWNPVAQGNRAQELVYVEVGEDGSVEEGYDDAGSLDQVGLESFHCGL